MVSEVDYEEVYHEVPFSIPPGDFSLFHVPDKTKTSFSGSVEI